MPRKTSQKPASSTTFGPEASVTTYTVGNIPTRWTYHKSDKKFICIVDGKGFATVRHSGRGGPLTPVEVKQLLDALNGAPSSSITVTWTADNLAGPKVKKAGNVTRSKKVR